jgi:hypothetical protein
VAAALSESPSDDLAFECAVVAHDRVSVPLLCS